MNGVIDNMKRIIKKIILTSLSLLFICTNFVSANSSLDLQLCINEMNNFINDNIQLGDNDWNNLEIVNYDEIYDANLNAYGYVFELTNNIKEGYGIVLRNSDGKYVITEASSGTPSPYKNNKENLNVYYTPLEYYSVSSVNMLSNEITLTNLKDGKAISSEDASFEKYSVEINTNAKTTRDSSRASAAYIKSYNSAFEKMTQVDGSTEQYSSCIPVSFAMSLKYLHNIGSLTLSSYYQNKTNIKKYLYSKANCNTSTGCTATNITSALKTFSDNYISGATIRTRDDGFQPDTKLSIAQDEVDTNCPPIIIFYPGALSTNPRANHATTMVGYRTLPESSGGQQYDADYIIVVDPMESASSNAKLVLWNSSNVFGYMIIYFW